MDDTFRPIEGFPGYRVSRIGEVESCWSRHRVVALDMFDKPETCRKVWDRLLSGVVMDALEGGEPGQRAEATDVEALLGRLRGSSWEPAPAVGEGQEYRSASDEKTHASALVCDGSVLHGSVVVAS